MRICVGLRWLGEFLVVVVVVFLLLFSHHHVLMVKYLIVSLQLFILRIKY